MIDRAHELPLTRQAALIGISRSAVYYQAVAVSERDLALMRRIDELHLEQPFWGSRGLLRMLLRDASIQPWIEQQPLGRKHVSTLMRRMGIEAQCPKPGTSRKGRGPRHQVFPYLLGGVDLSRIEANTLWALDTTYIPMRHGFAYLSAVIDVASRRVLAHKLCTTLEAYHAVEIVEQAIHRYGTPEIVNTDQGSQFTALEFVESVTNRGIPCLCRSQRSTERCPSVARLVLFLGAPAAQCHGECIGGLFALASHLAQHDAQGKRLASTASEWSRSIISASGWRKKSAVRGGSGTGKPPGNWIPIR